MASNQLEEYSIRKGQDKNLKKIIHFFCLEMIAGKGGCAQESTDDVATAMRGWQPGLGAAGGDGQIRWMQGAFRV